MTYDPITGYDTEGSEYRSRTSTSSMLWLWVPLIVVLVGGLGLAFIAYQQNDITILEALIGGFVGLSGLFIGLLVGLFGLVVGLFAGLFSLVAAGGAIAITLFVLASPVLAIIFLALLFRRSKECPDPSVHGYDS